MDNKKLAGRIVSGAVGAVFLMVAGTATSRAEGPMSPGQFTRDFPGAADALHEKELYELRHPGMRGLVCQLGFNENRQWMETRCGDPLKGLQLQ